MALYILENFEWYRRNVVFRPGPLSYNYEELCPNFDLVVAEEHGQIYELPKLPQVVFMAMLLNNVVKLGVLSGRMITVMESILTELRWNAFQAWTGHNRVYHYCPSGLVIVAYLFDAMRLGLQAYTMGRRPYDPSLSWGVYRSNIYIRYLVPHRHVARTEWCPNAGQAEECCQDHVSKADWMVIALGSASSFGLPSAYYKKGMGRLLQWSLTGSPDFRPNPLPKDYHGLRPGFNLTVVTQYAHDSNIPEMVQDRHELHNVSLRRLDWNIIDRWLWGIELRLWSAQVAHLANPSTDPMTSSGPVEDSGLSDAPPASSDEK
ncbi:hypothetical protein Cgig2_010236 [Carnegiea gigantea]|uniref:Uncharacterized protein n=1 Tax=Carnegiea gigantea TaxID=171969 RepID=A0A9Q1GH84_9CARY|nr:hypothetical protein Cgig2_010236 [Carnegiea gigantea]